MHANDPMGKSLAKQRRREPRDSTQNIRSEPNKCACFSEPPFTVAGFGEFMGVVPKTVLKWVEAQKLEAFRDGRIIRITPAAARKFIRRKIK